VKLVTEAGAETQGESESRPKTASKKEGTEKAQKVSGVEVYCEPSDKTGPLTEVLQRIRAARKRPLFALIAHFIDDDVCQQVYRWKGELRSVGKAEPLDILIHSPGGHLNECYRVARLFSRCADDWEALVPACAASGATLICLGSSKVVLSEVAFLGPMDPQVVSKRRGKFFEMERQSPLEAFQAVRYLREFSLASLDAAMFFLLERGVAAQPALQAAARLAVDLVTPILHEIDPFDLGAFSLDSRVAENYCRRVAAPANESRRTQRTANYGALVEEYPSHEFVIDVEEARSLGFNVEEPTEEVDQVFDELRGILDAVHTYIGLVPDRSED